MYVICNEMFHAERWTVVSDGGRGSNGQNGGNGQCGLDGQDATSKMTLSDFERDFPSMARWVGGKAGSGINTTLRTLESILPRESRVYGQNTRPGNYSDCFFIEGTPSDRGTITVSYYCATGLRSVRNSIILCKG